MKYFDDFKMGEKIVTKGRTITEADIVLFAAFSGDWHQLHTNVEFAKNGPFGERIAHGFLVLSVASGLKDLREWRLWPFMEWITSGLWGRPGLEILFILRWKWPKKKTRTKRAGSSPSKLLSRIKKKRSWPFSL